MPKHKRRICLACSQPLVGRSDAKTCSVKCRKRFQRAKILYRNELAYEERHLLVGKAGNVLINSGGGYYAER